MIFFNSQLNTEQLDGSGRHNRRIIGWTARLGPIRCASFGFAQDRPGIFDRQVTLYYEYRRRFA